LGINSQKESSSREHHPTTVLEYSAYICASLLATFPTPTKRVTSPRAAFPRTIMLPKNGQIRRLSFSRFLVRRTPSRRSTGRKSNNFRGAFTPGCSVKHLPPYIENLKTIKDKGVDVVAVVAFNDAWVMSAWGKANGVEGDDIVSPPTWQPSPASK
jgi:Redoxin